MKQVTVESKRHGYPIQTVLELQRRNSILFGVAGLHVGLLVVFVIGIILDPRTVAEDPVWLKPAKFAASIALLTATLGWLGRHLPVPGRTLRRVSLGVAATALIEMLLISGQAARCVESHFNDTTTLDTVVYMAMGVTILAMTVLVAWLLIQSWHQEFDVAPAFAWGIRFGMALFVLGARDGGPRGPCHRFRPNAARLRVGPEWRFPRGTRPRSPCATSAPTSRLSRCCWRRAYPL